MPNQRAPGQKLINVPMTQNFIDALNRSVRKAGYDDRSKFIRDAITEKLKREGFEVPAAEDRMAPDRTGKGGRRGGSVAEDREHTVMEDAPVKEATYKINRELTKPTAIHDHKHVHGTNSKKVSDGAKASRKGASRAAGVRPKSSP